MKKLPKKLEYNLMQCAKYQAKANALMNEVEEYLQLHGLSKVDYRDGCGVSLEEIEYAECSEVPIEKLVPQVIDHLNSLLAEVDYNKEDADES